MKGTDTRLARNESAAPMVGPSASSPYNPGEKQMSVSDETTTVSDGILLSDAAASKVKALLEQEGRDDWRCASPFSPAAARACATSSSSTSVRSTGTW